MMRAQIPALPLPPAPRPVKRETLEVWRAAVVIRKAHLRTRGQLRTVYRLGEHTHVVDGRQITTAQLVKRAAAIDPLYIPRFLRRR